MPSACPTPPDISRLLAELAQSRHEADHDELTGLLNRRGLRRRLALANARVSTALVFCDIDGLKKINESDGHAAGDAAIQKAGESLRYCLREGDLVARWGGDEFLAILWESTPDCDQGRPVDAQEFAGWFRDRLDARLPPSQPLRISLGMAHGPVADFATLLAQADDGLRLGRRNGRP